MRKSRVVSLKGQVPYGSSKYDFIFDIPPDEGWFDAKQYCTSLLGDVLKPNCDIPDLSQMKLWELLDSNPPQTLKGSSMRLMRHKRRGFLRKRRKGRAHIYRLTVKGWFEAITNYDFKHRMPPLFRMEAQRMKATRQGERTWKMKAIRHPI